MAATPSGPASGSFLSGHDVLYAYPADYQHNGTLISGAGTDTVMPRVTLADAVTQRVKWVWAIPVHWDAIRVNMGVTNEIVGTGNVRWQFAYRLINLGEGDVNGAVTTILDTLVSGGQFDFTYHQIAASIATPVGPLGDSPFMLAALSRLGGDAADTLAGGISVDLVAATRVDLA